jgi:hypothetical protein
MPTVFFDTNALYIKGYRDSFTAGSLTADFTPFGVGVRVLHGTDYLVNDAWQNYTREDGSGFVSADDLMAYLTAQFAMRRPVGTVITPYPLTDAASFSVDHGLAYAPRTTVVTADGAEVDTDVVHMPGRTTLTFASPFTGTLYLG